MVGDEYTVSELHAMSHGQHVVIELAMGQAYKAARGTVSYVRKQDTGTDLLVQGYEGDTMTLHVPTDSDSPIRFSGTPEGVARPTDNLIVEAVYERE